MNCNIIIVLAYHGYILRVPGPSRSRVRNKIFCTCPRNMSLVISLNDYSILPSTAVTSLSIQLHFVRL